MLKSFDECKKVKKQKELKSGRLFGKTIIKNRFK